ncbi:MAG: B12-binding domain-containing radical SAM protein [Eubacteriales bacterium]|nr:B12-binding domain-containing radical SAM protein [Eubacteriales bacterium]
MKFLLTAINAKYIHSNPGVYSLKTYAEHVAGAAVQDGEAAESCSGCGAAGAAVHGGAEAEPCSVCGAAGAAAGQHVQVEIAEYTINNQMEQILEDIYRRKPDVIGISCYIWNVVYALDLVRDLHKVLPETDIWLGGPEVSFDAPELLGREPEVLGVMKGEGEETFAALLQCYETLGGTVRQVADDAGTSRIAVTADGADENRQAEMPDLQLFWDMLSKIPGLAYRTDSGEIRDQQIRSVMDMSRIPFLYPNLEGFEHRIVYYESSRGCPFSCSYCLSSIDKSVRFRSMELVKRELDFFLERKVPQVKFVDRTFNCKKSHAMEIWSYILDHDNGVTNFHFEIAADLLDQEELELIGRMRPGLIQLEIGVQSTNPETIQEIHRHMDLDRVREVVATVNAGHNVHQHLDLIAGLPYEDYESFRRSFNDVYAMDPEQLQLGFLKVLKGSFMYENAAAYQLVYRTLPPYEVLSTRWLPYGDVLRLKGIEDMVEVYYNSRQFTRTLELLVQEFPDAFTMFEELAEYYSRRKLTGMNHSRLARYEILYDFIREVIAKKTGEAVARTPNAAVQAGKAAMEAWSRYGDALICDVYLRENSKSRPAFAPDLSAYKNQIRELVPELRSLGTLVHVEVLRSGEVLLFDYRSRDPLTRNAAVRRVGTIRREAAELEEL